MNAFRLAALALVSFGICSALASFIFILLSPTIMMIHIVVWLFGTIYVGKEIRNLPLSCSAQTNLLLFRVLLLYFSAMLTALSFQMSAVGLWYSFVALCVGCSFGIASLEMHFAYRTIGTANDDEYDVEMEERDAAERRQQWRKATSGCSIFTFISLMGCAVCCGLFILSVWPNRLPFEPFVSHAPTFWPPTISTLNDSRIDLSDVSCVPLFCNRFAGRKQRVYLDPNDGPLPTGLFLWADDKFVPPIVSIRHNPDNATLNDGCVRHWVLLDCNRIYYTVVLGEVWIGLACPQKGDRISDRYPATRGECQTKTSNDVAVPLTALGLCVEAITFGFAHWFLSL